MRKIKIPGSGFVCCLLLLVAGCAKRGTITGGDKDTTPPKIISSSPANFSTNFDKKTIKITFDEYVRVKDLQKNLIVSPPMKIPVTVLPQGIASKNLIIKINDTLRANTTYSFNFGQSIADNNEGNVLKQLKYVFSTGAFVDSLSVEGTIKDSYEKETESFINVMLYEVDSDFTDSIIYKETPRYITNTSDSLKTFRIDNVKAGQYRLIALKEKPDNYKFDPKRDKIAFYDKTITIPDKAIFELELFKEAPEFDSKKPVQASANRIIAGYEGDPKELKIDVKQRNNPIKAILTKYAGKDSVQVWFQPIKNDSLQLMVQNGKYQKGFSVRLGNQKQDTLRLFPKQNAILRLNDNFAITSATPLEKWDVAKMKLFKKDATAIAFKTNYDAFNQNLEVLFDKDPDEKYTFSLFPNAVEDYLGQKNDSLSFSFSTKNPADYGNLKLNLQKVKSYPVIVELTDAKGKILASASSETSTVEFLLLEPQKYSLRVIYDENKNGKRDSGNYLKKQQPEEVIHYPSEIDVRANWDVNQDVDLSH